MMKKGVNERVREVKRTIGVTQKKCSAEPRITVDLTDLNKFFERPAYSVRPCPV